MLAICAARGANDADVIANLKKAAELDADYAKRAKTDIEFAKYWPVAEFQAIAK